MDILAAPPRRRATDPQWQVMDQFDTPHGAPRSRHEAESFMLALHTLEPTFGYHLVAA